MGVSFFSGPIQDAIATAAAFSIPSSHALTYAASGKACNSNASVTFRAGAAAMKTGWSSPWQMDAQEGCRAGTEEKDSSRRR